MDQFMVDVSHIPEAAMGDCVTLIGADGEERITVEMLGHGHRVGMSQYGANAMAEAGYACEQILAHYYQGVVIDKVGLIG